MPSVSYNGQCFSIDGRRTWILGASMHYTRMPAAEWADRIARARHAGFNTIEVPCPWMVHEPRKGRYHFEDNADLTAFIKLIGEQKMRAILRPGPFIGSGFAGGGMPNWLSEIPGIALRENNEPFLERVTRYFRKLLSDLTDLQITKGGPILLVQIEHAWFCGNDRQAETYLREIARVIRESGIAVPLINANNLWSDSIGTIDTWRGDDDLLANLRQLRSIHTEAPRIVSIFESWTLNAYGRPKPVLPSGADLLRRLAEVLATGAQLVVSPFHAGTNFAFQGGQLPGPAGGLVTTAAAAGTPLGEAGLPSENYSAVKRIVTFANHFSHVFSDLDPDYQPVVMDPIDQLAAPVSGLAIVPQRGPAGRLVFVFSDGKARRRTLVLDNGVRLPIDLGIHDVGWYAFEVDLNGSGRLDYANLCPLLIVDRSVLVLFGPAKSEALLSINGTPFQSTVPSGSKPEIIEHKGLVIAICNQQQIDSIYHDDRAVYFGLAEMDANDRPIPQQDGKSWTLTKSARLEPVASSDDNETSSGRSSSKKKTAKKARTAQRTSTTARSVKLNGWQGASTAAYAHGESPRFASLKGPETLPACGASVGYGWYRVALKLTSGKKRLLHVPFMGDRMHLYEDGKLCGIYGFGPGATAPPFEMSFKKGEATVTALLDSLGRFADGNDLARRVGLFGHFYEIKPLRNGRSKKIEAEPVDPFDVRGFILGAPAGQLSDEHQLEWSFSHLKKSPILVDIAPCSVSGTFVLNDEPIHYYAGDSGAQNDCVVLEPSSELFRRGKNVLRFAPDLGFAEQLPEMQKATTLYESVEIISESATWSFAKWEPPPGSGFKEVGPSDGSKYKGMPAWWRVTFDQPTGVTPLWFDTQGLSKGQAFINHHNLGRYFTATHTNKAVGPQHRLFIPRSWLHNDKPNELLVFDEHGFSPLRTKLALAERGDLD